MATVWLARDLKHERPVALKLIRPELSAILGGERFLREIRLTAQLQHPHILTLIDSGQAAGVLYYVMPYVAGESLRQRLARESQLSVDEAGRLSRVIAAALDYAHGLGIVHRDIKPENILLYQGEPMVADFGIALAAGQAGGERLTETGLSLGTPAYMSPEQATADPRIDGRSDQYSLACVVYEMLAGEPPYTGPTAQAVISKRLSAPIPSVRHSRADVPERVDAAVRRGMASVPADRFPTVTAFAAALSGGPKATLPRSRRLSPIAWVGAAAAVAAVLLAVGGRHFIRPARAASLLDPNLVVVAPLENRTGDPSLAPFGLMAADWVTQQLTGTEIIRVVDAQSMLLAANQSARDAPSARLSALAKETGAGTAVVGNYYKDADSLRVQVRVIDARSGAVRSAVPPVAGSVRRPTAVLEALSTRVTGTLAALLDERLTTWRLPSTSPPSFEAYREFLVAMQFHATYDEEHAVPHFQRAAALDSTFWQAHLWTGMEYGNLGQVDRMDSVFQRIERYRTALSPYDQANLDYFERAFVSGRWDEAHTAALKMVQLAPGAAHPLYGVARTALALNRPHEAIAAMQRIDRSRGWGQSATYTYRFLAAASHLVGDEVGQRRAAESGPEDTSPASTWNPALFTVGVLLSKAGGSTLVGLDRPTKVVRRLDSLAQAWSGTGLPPGFIGRAAAAEARYHGHALSADSLSAWTIAWFDQYATRGHKPDRTVQLQRALALGETGHADKGLVLAQSVLRAEPNDIDALTVLGILQARLGHTVEARRAEQQIADRSGRDWLGLRRYRRACITAHLNDPGAALTLLDEARGLGLEAWAMHADPNLEPLWHDDRFQALVRSRD
jgi:TolB-like protein